MPIKKRMPTSNPPSGSKLSAETLRRVNILFREADRERAKELLVQLSYREIERVRFAALKYSDGRLDYLERAIELGNLDFRDLLMAVDFGSVEAHLRWQPKPADEPSCVDIPRLAELIHQCLASAFTLLGFIRDGNLWSRSGHVRQTIALEPGLGSRVQARFFVKLTLHSQPIPLMMMLPRLPENPLTVGQQGYIFKAGESEDVFVGKVHADLTEVVLPMLERFTNEAEIQIGLTDGSFKRRMQLKEQILLL